MKKSMFHARLLIVFTLLGSACSSMPQDTSSLLDSSLAEQDSLSAIALPVRASNLTLAPLGEVAIGQVANLSAENPLGVTRARVVNEYSAASGRLCRRVTIAEKQQRLRLVCREPGGDWSLVRGLVAAKR